MLINCPKVSFSVRVFHYVVYLIISHWYLHCSLFHYSDIWKRADEREREREHCYIGRGLSNFSIPYFIRTYKFENRKTNFRDTVKSFLNNCAICWLLENHRYTLKIFKNLAYCHCSSGSSRYGKLMLVDCLSCTSILTFDYRIFYFHIKH